MDPWLGRLQFYFKMLESEDYSLFHVVKCLKSFIKNFHGKQLYFEYKFAKPFDSVEGNKKFDQILQNSYENIIIMNANRELKRPYVHLKSMTYPHEVDWFKKNLQSLLKIHKLKIMNSQKIDLKYFNSKISFESETKKWVFKNKKNLFRPNYEAVMDGKLFRIALSCQTQGDREPKKKVIQMLEEALQQAIQCQKNESQVKNKGMIGKKVMVEIKQGINYQTKDSRDHKNIPLRFKREQQYVLNEHFSVLVRQVYQKMNPKLLMKILQLVKNKKYSQQGEIGKILLSTMVNQIFKQFKDELVDEVEFKFQPFTTKMFYEMDDSQIEEYIVKTAAIFVKLSKDPNEFSAEEVVQKISELQEIQFGN